MHYIKKNKKNIIIFAALALLFEMSINCNVKVFAEGNDTKNKKTILIDPGHGGYDGWAEGKSGIKEKDINLSISLKLRDTLISKGYEVIMTREEDKDLLGSGFKSGSKKAQDLSSRCKIKNESKADLFISIHQNYFPQGKYYGAQVWYSNNEESKDLGHIIQENFKMDLDKNNRRVEKAAKDDYKILRCSDVIPSVLVECGFLSNYEEEQKLRDEGYQQKVADSLVKSIIDYLSED